MTTSTVVADDSQNEFWAVAGDAFGSATQPANRDRNWRGGVAVFSRSDNNAELRVRIPFSRRVRDQMLICRSGVLGGVKHCHPSHSGRIGLAFSPEGVRH